ncbi:MAG: major capsid protein [Arizlama microvirus]|nr:MAG: major capsid protein [Arizlama microvirus]
MMHRNQSASSHQFALAPSADVPRSTFNIEHTHKTTFDAAYLIPIYVDEVLPGDQFNGKLTAFARLATPIAPIMDNLYLETFFFYVPWRIVWANFRKFMGEQTNPGDSIAYTVPQIVSAPGGFNPNNIYDYMGLPCVGQIQAGQTISINALYLRAYNKIYNDWFRDENLTNSRPENTGDGPDNWADYTVVRRAKRPDYFTMALPWPQKGGTPVSLPLGTTAPVIANPAQPIPALMGVTSGTVGMTINRTTALANSTLQTPVAGTAGEALKWNTTANTTGLLADLSTATAATINDLRNAFQIQRLLERDARGGTRYIEILKSHFGVTSPDGRLQRPEYIGGGQTPIIINPIAQTSGTGQTGQTTPLGNLGAVGTGLAHGHTFSYSATEHGCIIGLANVRADITYQQGIRKIWSRLTKYDHYWPVFANLGEQTILTKEIYATGVPANDNAVFGYQERWAEYRYHPSQITGLFRSTTASTIDLWHLAQRFTAAPVLSATFINDTPPMDRVLALGAGESSKQILFDGFFKVRATRPMPMYSVPGMIDHF